MIKHLAPALLALAGLGGLAAEEQASRPTLGFEFGAGFHLYNDDRFDGTSVNFALMYQVNSVIRAGIYHEGGHIHGEEDGADVNYDTDIVEFRIGVDLALAKTQSVALVLGIGHAEYTEDIDESEMVFDAAIRYTPVRAASGPVIGELAINAAYRYAPMNDVGSGLTEDLDDLGGFIVGLGAGLYF